MHVHVATLVSRPGQVPSRPRTPHLECLFSIAAIRIAGARRYTRVLRYESIYTSTWNAITLLPKLVLIGMQFWMVGTYNVGLHDRYRFIANDRLLSSLLYGAWTPLLNILTLHFCTVNVV